MSTKKKKNHFISGPVLKDNARIVQKYNRIVAYLGGDDELLQKISNRIEEYKVLGEIYDEWKSGADISVRREKVNAEYNRNKKYDFFIRMLDGNENDERHFVRRRQMNMNIEQDIDKFKNASKEAKINMLQKVLVIPAYRQAKNVLGEGIVLMCDKFATKGCYSGYTEDWKDEMKSDACTSILRGIEGYDCDMESSIFAYFTETIKNCYNSYCANRKREAQNIVGLDFIDNIQKGFKFDALDGDV